jgi:biopolymer transport protein ExbB
MKPKHLALKLTLLLLVAFFFPAIPLLAQEAAKAAAGGDNTSFIDLLKQGGWAMWPLGLFSMASVGLMIYNGLTIRPQPFLRTDLTSRLGEAMNALDIDQARQICADNPAPVTNIVAAGLSRIEEDHIEMTAVDKALDEASSAELSGPFVLIHYLSVIGAVAPMVGLLGTVSGMVKAFRAISDVGMGDPSVLATNISEALITTASGLVVAIPSLIAYFYFKSKYGRIASQVGKIVGDLFFNLISAARRSA